MSGPAALARRADWPERLQEVLDRHAALPFGWGSSDCLLLPMDGVLAMTGVDPAAAIRGTYRSARGAARQLARRGHAHVGEAFAAHFPEIAPALAHRGDLGLIRVPEGSGYAGVILFGLGAFGKAAAGGTVFVPRSAILRAFRI